MSDGHYKDLNQTFFRERFERALGYDDYLATAEPRHAARWAEALERTVLGADQRERLSRFVRRLNVLVLSGAWCGDCVRQGPILRRLAEAAPSLDLRWLDRDAEPELADLLRINGALKVPVVVFLSEDFYEVGRFGDRTLSVYRAKAERELGPACETGLVPPEPERLAVEIGEWVDIFERMHLILRTAPLLRARYGD